MDTSAITDSPRAFSKNLAVLACAVAARAALSCAMSAFVTSYALIELSSLAAFLVAAAVLARLGVLSPGSSESPEEADGATLGKSAAAGLFSVATPLMGFCLCQATQGIGWGAVLSQGESLVYQTPYSFAMVEVGAFLCAVCLLAVHGRVGNIVNFHYRSILACLLLLVVPWVSADLSGDARVLITALPWGFSSSMLGSLVVVGVLSLRRGVRAVVAGLSLLAFALSVLLGMAGFFLLGDAAANVLWRSLVIVLLAYVGLDILREYQSVERRLAEAASRYDESAIEGFCLTAREREVLDLLLQGRRATWIAQRLYISDSTARAHIRHIYQKSGVHSREELIDLLSRGQGQGRG